MSTPLRGCLLVLAGILAAAPGLRAQDPGDSLPHSRHISLSEALDSAGLAARLRSLPELPTRKRAVVSVTFAPSGQVDSVAVGPGDRVPPELLSVLEEAVRAHLKPQPRDTIRRFASIALRTGSRVSLSPPEARKPRLRNASTISGEVGRFARRNSELFRDGAKTAMVRLVARADGRTESAGLVRSSGVEAVDAEALRIAGMFRFEPAMVEGEAVPVLILLPISFYR